MDLSLSLYKLDNINATFSLSLAASAAGVLVVQKSSGDELYAWQDSNSFRRPE